MLQTETLSAVVPFVDRLADFGDRPAVVASGATLTYRELAERVADARARLGTTRRLVLVEADRTLDGLVGYLGALAGRHVVLLVPAGQGGPAGVPVGQGGPAGVPVGQGGPAGVDGATAIARSFAPASAPSAAPGEPGAAIVERYDPDVVTGPSSTGWRVLERRPGTRHDLHPDLALLLSTSGSSGSPKLVRLSAESLQANAESVAESLGIRPGDRAITTLPMSYCYGLSVVHSHLCRGASLVLTDASVVDPCFWDEVRRQRVTSLAGVPYTFELLERVGFAEMTLPDLRYVTQAGGRMPPERVAAFAELGRRRGWDLVVMYGQTEATARMATLPPEAALTRPGAVGLAVPGGRFRIEPVADDGTPPGGAGSGGVGDAVGEVVYEGPNVMLGYAETPADLALGRTTTELRTGDLGRLGPDGLLEITGRRSSFVKIVGTRVDLGRVDAVAADLGWTACSSGDDDTLVVAVEDCAHPRLVRGVLATELHLPASAIRVVPVEEIPRLPTGKPDRAAVRGLGAPADAATAAPAGPAPAAPVAGPAPEAPVAAPAAPGDGRADPGARPHPASRAGDASSLGDLVALFAEALDRPEATPESTFVGLGGDSLSFVSLSVRLEDALGTLPRDWHLLPIRELDRRRTVRDRAWATVETAVALRAAAIVAVVGTHAGLFTLRGGAHLLLGVAGYHFARFTLASDPAGRSQRVARGVARVALPSIVWIAVVAIVTGQYRPSTALLVNGVAGPDRWGPDWHYWYVEALVWILVGAGVLLALPGVTRVQLRAPFPFALGLAIIGLLPRFEVIEVWTGPERGTPQYIAWIFAVGWAIAAASATWQRAVVSLLVLIGVPGFFDDPLRDAVVALGLLALTWVSTVRLPRPVARLGAALASASLAVYLTHWQVYPLLDGVPAAALAASLAVGVGAWVATTRLQRLVAVATRRHTPRSRRLNAATPTAPAAATSASSAP